MADLSTTLVAAPSAPPAALAAQAWLLEPPPSHERRGLLREESARLVDSLLVRVARGRGALDVAIGDGLGTLSVGDRALRLGFSGIGDYACERLGMEPGTAKRTARLARALRERPALREAVRRGDVSARKATVVLPVASGEAEAAWVERARTSTVRALEVAVREERAARGGGSEGTDRDEPWERVDLALGPEERARVDAALELAGKLLGAASPRWQRLEAMAQEFLGAHPDRCADVGTGEGDGGGGLDASAAEWLDAARAALEEETACWAALEAIDPVLAPELDCDDGDLHRLDAELRSLVAMQARWDELLGHLAMLLRSLGLWRDAGFVSFAHYCEERLGMAARTVEQRATLERRLHALPALRVALRDGRVSYEKARLVASVADDASVDLWIARAESSTCAALRREIDSAGDAQMCARSELSVCVPSRVASLLDAAFRAARAAAGTWLTPGECLVQVADHFITTWEGAVRARRSRHRAVLARDRGCCRVPGCSHAAAHLHHVLFRSRGGDDAGDNLVSLCAAHHLHAVHRGWVRVWGRAPDALRWELGVRPGGPPLVVYEPAAR
ncbi:HNH endonuclease signature motif containing protein [Anaeromyxobacter oryzae]|uniref:HNH nuclease domain-containing protein n=1 Tax=Anaeromyxobacter oryzae TaxID=2918170 RepID=A0ABM7WWM1_9BACT|nr:HNH endonuclease signature motif containing protein [Anaeromyxobacter oryzae]BDG03887.1 hypothetical protein AMOR_28830 [Anaeromyxobacter oryzae]